MKRFFDSLNPSVLFVCTLLCLPGIVFQSSLVCLWIDVVLFAALTFLKKGRIRVVPPLLMCASIVFFNLLKTDGLVLFSVFSFKVTQGALKDGLHKSGILSAMVFVSQYGVSRFLHLPGKTGGFLSRVFFYFDKLSEQGGKGGAAVPKGAKKTFKPFSLLLKSVTALMEKTDEHLLNVFFSETDDDDCPKAELKAPAAKYAFVQIPFSVLPLFPVYLLLILARQGFFPV